ncbi:MAG TPA: hypothetical protein VN259_09100 [Xanthomonadales bacterium]|nr:hypothetical protein [Xanthomonadales bacterium]
MYTLSQGKKVTPRTFYVAAEEAFEGSRQYLSMAIVSPGGQWFYVEVTDVDASVCSQRAREHTLAQMRKVTETLFVKSVNLRSAVAAWLVRNSPENGASIEVRSVQGEPVDVGSLRKLLQGHEDLSERLVGATCSVDAQAFEQGIARCGGRAKVGASAIVRAVLAAVCDQARRDPMGALHTQRFELLMGTRNATSLRAWIRRYERDRALAGMPARAVGARRRAARESAATLVTV